MSDQLIMANLLFERHVLHTSILIDVIFIILAELTISVTMLKLWALRR